MLLFNTTLFTVNFTGYLKCCIHLPAPLSYIESKDLKVLTYNMLSAGFCLWLISVGIACIFVVAENAPNLIKMCVKKGRRLMKCMLTC